MSDNITELECELARKYYELGKSVCEMSEARVEEINKLVDKIIEVKRTKDGGNENDGTEE